MVTPACSLVKNTPASLYRQAGKNHTGWDLDDEFLRNYCTVYRYVSKASFPTGFQWLPGSRMFLLFWPQEVELLDTHIHPEMHSTVWWDRKILFFFSCFEFTVKGVKLNGQGFLYFQNLDDSDWTNGLYTSPISAMENTCFFTHDITNLSSALLKEDDPGEAGGWIG